MSSTVNMLTTIHTVIALTCIVFGGNAINIGVRFGRKCGPDRYFSGTTLNVLPGVSKLVCGIECGGMATCLSFSYRSANEVCELKNDTALRNCSDVNTDQNAVYFEKVRTLLLYA